MNYLSMNCARIIEVMAEEQQATTFSAAEAAVYDRQMRLWGVEAQKRLQSSRVLVSGLSALGSELVKNLVLAGMGVTLHDTQRATSAAAASQFFLSEADVGSNVRAKRPLSLLILASIDPNLTLRRFDCSAPRPACRACRSSTRWCKSRARPSRWPSYRMSSSRSSRSCASWAPTSRQAARGRTVPRRRLAFFAARSFGFDGIVFADLGAHTFRRSAVGADATPSEPVIVHFPTLEQAQKVQWSSLQSARKRAPQLPQVFVKNQRECCMKSGVSYSSWC